MLRVDGWKPDNKNTTAGYLGQAPDASAVRQVRVMVSAGEPYTTLAPPMRGNEPYRAPALEGLDDTTTIHVAWLPPYDNGVEIDVFQLYADGVLQKNVTASSPQFILSGLIPATTHNFSVRAVNARGVGELSTPVWLNTSASVPGMPEGKPVIVSKAESLTVSVTPALYMSGSPFKRYDVKCEATSPVPQCNGTWVPLPPGSDTYTVDDYQRELTYTFVSRVVNEIGEGAASEELVVSGSLVSLPPSPLELALVPGSELPRSFNISWRLPQSAVGLTDPVTRYEVQLLVLGESVPATSPLTVAAPLCQTTCTARVTAGVLPAQIYTVQLASVNEIGNSIASEEITVHTPGAEPDPPTLKAGVLMTADSLTVEWTAGADNGAVLQGYDVYACDAAGSLCAYANASGDATGATVAGLAAADLLLTSHRKRQPIKNTKSRVTLTSRIRRLPKLHFTV